MLWYQFAPLETYLVAGRLNDVLTLTGANLQQDTNLEESHYYRGRGPARPGSGSGRPQRLPGCPARQSALRPRSTTP